MRFIKEFSAFAVRLDSVGSVMWKMILVASLFLPQLFDERLYFAIDIKETTFASSWTVGTICAVLVWAALMIIGGTVAWMNSRGPLLRVATTLEPDTEHDVFRLSVWNNGEGIASPTAQITWLESEDGQQHSTITPIPLRWMHEVLPNLSYRQEAKIDVVYVRLKDDMLWFGRPGYFRHVKMRDANGHLIGASLRVGVSLPGTRRYQERSFRLEPDDIQHLRIRSVSI